MPLVLSRRLNESVVIGGDARCPRIVVKVVTIDRGKIRLMFEAPDGVEIWRSELLSSDGSLPPPALKIPQERPCPDSST